MIDRYHLRYFLAVIDAGNFSRAAVACNVSQPTLSAGIAKLERQLGRPVFVRSNKRVELTEAGARLASHARSIEAGFAQAERDATGSAAIPKLRLGVLTSLPRLWIKEFLLGRREGQFEGHLEVVEGRARELYERLARGRIDVALTILRGRNEPLEQRSLFTEGYRLAMSLSHPLAARTVVSAEELINDPMIVRRHCEALADTSRFFTSRGVRPFFPARTISDDRALDYVRAGLGVTVMPDGFLDPAIARPLLDGFDVTREIGLLYGSHVDPRSLDHNEIVSSLSGAMLAAHEKAGPDEPPGGLSHPQY